MSYEGLADFVRVLEEQGELVRIGARVDPHLELAAIADRVMKAGGPALHTATTRRDVSPVALELY